MTTNREWLYSLDVADLADWFDAEHVDANNVSTRKGDVRADDVCANDGFMDLDSCTHGVRTFASESDSREKLEADVYRAADEMEEFTHGEKFINTNKILRWLNRQAAITAEETSGAWEEYRDATQREIAELTAERDGLKAQVNSWRERNGGNMAMVDSLAKQVNELRAERDNLARDLAECDENRIEFRDQRDRAEEMLAQMERERDYWKLHADCWADKCKDAESERDAYHERTCELEIELAQANGILKNTTHNHAAAKAKYERAQADAARAREKRLEAERRYAELLEKPPEGAWAERIAVLEAGNRELREKLSEAIGHAHEIGKLGDLEGAGDGR